MSNGQGNTLHLNLHRKWFDMILSGEKKEEYRQMNSYWESRLIDKNKQLRLDAEPGLEIAWKQIHHITFSNGYAKDRDQFVIELKGIELGGGRPEWGGRPDGDYYILKLGEILSKRIKP